MMQKLFLTVLNMSLAGSIVILAVLAARILLKRAPKAFSYALWGVVLFRLLCPVTIESYASVMPDIPSVEAVHVNTVLPDIDFETFSDRQENIYSEKNAVEGEVGIKICHSIQPVFWLTALWITGVAVMWSYSVISSLKLRKKLKEAVKWKENIYFVDCIDTAFVMGVFCPRIFLPSSLSESEREYVLLHEKHHIRRLDHIVKLLFFVTLSIHWFNPLVWISFFLSDKDMEMSCDEAVIKKLGADVRADYSMALLHLASGHRLVSGTPLAFGEGDTKGRIRNLANWKAPKFWVILICIVLCVVILVIFIGDPVREKPAEVVGEYDTSTLGGEFLTSGNPDYDVGANIYGMPVFKNPEAALKALKKDYAQGLECIANAWGLSPVSQDNYKLYKKYAFQIDTMDDTFQQCIAVGQFFDIYENSYSSDEMPTSGNIASTASGIYTAGDLIAQNIYLSSFDPDGSYFAEIILSEGHLTVVSENGEILYSDDKMEKKSCSREELVERLSELPVAVAGGALWEKVIPQYDGFLVDICSFYRDDDSDQIAYTVYWFNGEPTWFAQGDNLRIYALKEYSEFSSVTAELDGIQYGKPYVSTECLYMNPMSSDYPIDGDSGYRYYFWDDAFNMESKVTGEISTIRNIHWQWSKLPYSMTQWADMQIDAASAGFQLIPYPENGQYQALGDGMFLLNSDEKILLAKYYQDPDAGTYFWYIYCIEPEKMWAMETTPLE